MSKKYISGIDLYTFKTRYRNKKLKETLRGFAIGESVVVSGIMYSTIGSIQFTLKREGIRIKTKRTGDTYLLVRVG